MGSLDRIKIGYFSPKTYYLSFSDDPCEDQTFAPRFKEKKINVFVSSTFRDMIAERDELTLKIFPVLRKECELRGIAWGEVDLRWGIPPEKSEQGETLNICLQYIDKCRPYFIGMLGERYGWVDPDTLEKVKGDFSWVLEQTDKSITELEILHGVLNNPNIKDHAFFYFRDKAYLESDQFKEKVPEEEQAGFFETEDEPKQKLTDLKNRIRNSGFPVREDYPDPMAFGELVKADLMKIIESLAPVPQEITEENKAELYLDREHIAHETFVASRFGVYIRRKEYFDQLDVNAAGGGEPLVVLGESGSGKSALLAHWAFAYREAHKKDLVLFHFVGASSASTDWAMMLRRIMGELKRECGIRMEIPTKEEDIRSVFVNFLSMAGKKKRVVLVIDALNQLDDKGGALDLTWLPPKVPEGIRITVSTCPGKVLDTLRKRDFHEMEVRSLTVEEQKRLIVCYFKQFHKEPSPTMIDELVRSEQCKNPLYLRAVLEEIRVHGVYEQIIDQVRDLLTADTIPALYEKILERYEHDYETDHPGLVMVMMSLLWASRRGLSKGELLDILGEDRKPLPDAIWAPFYLAAEKGFVERGGLLTFFHQYLRQAVKTKYLSDTDEINIAHHWLAMYFLKCSKGSRQEEELPWQLAKAEKWDLLVELLTEDSFFLRLSINRNFDLKYYWVNIEDETGIKLEEAYGSPSEHNHDFSDDFIHHLSVLLYQMGRLSSAYGWFELLEKKARDEGDLESLAIYQGAKGLILESRGDHDMAMTLHKEQERISREIGDLNTLQASLNNQANIQYRQGNLDGALKLYKETERICMETRDQNGLQRSFGNQANILADRGEFDKAIYLIKEQGRICRETGNIDDLHGSLGNLGMIMQERGDLDGAMTLYKEEEEICRNFGNIGSLFLSLNHQASILYTRGDLNGAMTLFKEVERICREMDDTVGLQASLNNQACILADLGDLDGAMAIHREDEQICKKQGNLDGLRVSLGNKALILHDRGDLDGAMALMKEEEEICRKMGNLVGLQASLGSQANILIDYEDLNGAMALCKEQERICREMEIPDSLQASLSTQAYILADQGDLDGAMALYKEQGRICREIGNNEDLLRSLGNQLLILKAQGDIKGLIALYIEEEQIFRRIGDLDGLQVSLYNQAVIKYENRDLEGAMKLLKEQELICRETGNKESLLESMSSQALILKTNGDLDGAMELYKGEEQRFKELGDEGGIAYSLAEQSLILKKKGEILLADTLIRAAYDRAIENGYTGLANKIREAINQKGINND